MCIYTYTYLYIGFHNIEQEFLARNNDFLELAACLGAFGSIVSAIQLYVLPHKTFLNIISLHVWKVTLIMNSFLTN